MANRFRIGRVFGIELRIDPSWLLIFALVSWSLTSLFATWHPDWPMATSITVALISALLFFGSVLVHELAHSVIARRYGVPVRDITLHLFGGVANIEKEPPSPGAEFFIAVVGPIVSIGLGLAMVLATAAVVDLHPSDVDSAAHALSRLDPVSTALVWLGPVNITVGLFNVIPGFPLDGGRILRAIVWKLTGSLQRATVIASGVGQAVGWMFVAMGSAMVLGNSLPFFGRGLVSGLWLAMIGLFLRNAAILTVKRSTIDEALALVHVSDLMRTQGPAVPAHVPGRQLVDRWFMHHDESVYPVMDDGVFAGVVSVEDVRKKTATTDERGWDFLTVREVMTPRERLVTTTRDEDLAVAVRKLESSDVRQLPVLERGVLVGMLSERDITRWLDLRARVSRPMPSRVRHA
jgi:Zn-dependent protease/predicted transcriptional regulator